MGNRCVGQQSNDNIASALIRYFEQWASMEPPKGKAYYVGNYKRHLDDFGPLVKQLERTIGRWGKYRAIRTAVGQEMAEYKRLLGRNCASGRFDVAHFVESRAALAKKALERADLLLKGVPIPIGSFPRVVTLDTLVHDYFKNLGLRRLLYVNSIGSIGAASLLIGVATLFMLQGTPDVGVAAA
ncbi:MAG: hypothetical protein HYT77_05510 [Deltaproteobacteria bacterium]|nr:hypothetical protein [Deltaproteobacteria bacterium]